jgi:NDP-sugar pyrophosphorylase family protein
MKKAMILAAGYGTRLKPHTNHSPKALIELNGIPMLEILIKKLIHIGIEEIVINIHHLADMIIDFLAKKRNFGINIQLSVEKQLLGTGGGIKNAAKFFNRDESFLVHNVDIISNIDLMELFHYHQRTKQLATLAVKNRQTKRYFIVDQNLHICGHKDLNKNIERIAKYIEGESRLLAFCGISIISSKIFSLFTENGNFSIIDTYLRLIAEGYPIGVYQVDHYYWKDIGRYEILKEVENDIINGII